MRTAALLLSVVVALSASAVRAEEPAPTTVVKQRGVLTSVGFGLLIGGLAGLGLGIASVINTNEKLEYRSRYKSMTDPADQPALALLEQSAKDFRALAVVGFIAGSLALAGGIVCLAADTPKATVAFVPTAEGGVFAFSARF